jgi:hypothetical protein
LCKFKLLSKECDELRSKPQEEYLVLAKCEWTYFSWKANNCFWKMCLTF